MPDAALAGPAGAAGAFVYVTFLPSPFGPGYEAGIRGWEGNYDPVDGWADGTYYRLAGIARVPAPFSRYCCPQWHKTVVDRLRRNGVVFLNDASAEAYMKTEGRYWLHWFFGDTPLLRRLLWSVVKPKTPISDESERLALAVTLIREHAGMPSVRAIVIIGESRPAKPCFQPARNRVELRVSALLVKNSDRHTQVSLCQPLAGADGQAGGIGCQFT